MNLIQPQNQQEKLLNSDFYVEGYAATWERYHLYGYGENEVFEQFDRDCLAGADMSDVIFQYDHVGSVFARMSNDTLIVKPDEKGIRIAADLSKTQKGKDLYEDISAGMITKMSWSFIPDYDSMEYDETTRTIYHRKVKKIFDVSAVSIPANDTTDIHTRDFVNGEIAKFEQELREGKRKKLKLMLMLGGF